MPRRLASFARERYDDVSATVGRLSDRHRPPDDYHAVYPLAAAARERFDALAAAAREGADAATVGA